MEHERDKAPAEASCIPCPTGQGLTHQGFLGAGSPEEGSSPTPAVPKQPAVGQGSVV